MPSSLSHTLKFRNWSALRYWLLWAYDGPAPARALTGHYGQPGSPDISCWRVRRGSVEVTVANKTLTARKNQWLFLSSGQRYQHFSPQCEIMSIHVNLSWPGNIPVIEQQEPYIIKARSIPQFEKSSLDLVQSVKAHFPSADANLIEHDSSILSFLEVQHKLPLWVKHYLEIQGNHNIYPTRFDIQDTRILKVINELDTRPLNRRFSERELIKLSSLSQSRFNVLFSQSTGVTPKQYFERRRLDAAKNLVISTQMSIKEIGFELGFLYDSHFSHWFRKHTGMSPTEARKNTDT